MTSISLTINSINEETEFLIGYTFDHFSPVTSD